MIIQHNISALNSYNRLSGNNKALAKNLEKLSSGYKINRAADDAAGLGISEKMRAQITGMNRAQQNSKDGISLVQTAEGALTEVHSMLNRMVDLTTQASNGVYTDDEKTKIKDELAQLESEIDRIADATNFNGIKLLDGKLGAAGTSGGSIATDLATTKIAATKGTSEQKTAYAKNADLDAVGAFQKFTLTFDDGSTVQVDVSIAAGKTAGNKQLMINGKAYGAEGNAAPTAQNVIDGVVEALQKELGDEFTVSGTGAKIKLEAKTEGSAGRNLIGTSINGMKSDGTTAVTLTEDAILTKGTDEQTGIKAADMTAYNGTNEDAAVFEINGKKFAVAADGTNADKLSPDVTLLIGTVAGDAKIAAQLSHELGIDVTYSANGVGGAAGYIFDAPVGEGAAPGGAGGGNGLRLQIGETADSFNQLDVNIDDCHAAALNVAGLNIDTPDAAAASMMKAKAAIEQVSKTRSLLGATQNRLDHTLANLEETTTNLTEAESRIRDTDMANEMMKYTKNNILIQSSQAMLAQANQVPQGVLQLLQ